MNNLSISNSNFPRRGRRLLQALFFVPVLLGLLFFVGAKNEILGDLLLYGSVAATPVYQGGDLYEINLIQNFKQDIKIWGLKPGSPVDQARYIVLGDSFFYLGLDSEPVLHYLQDTLIGGVFYQQKQQGITPVNYLNQAGFKKGAPKIFVWETVERSSLDGALALSADLNPPPAKQGKFEQLKSLAVLLANKLGPYLSIFKPDKPRVEYLIRNNLLAKPLVVWLKNKDFEWFGDIDNVTPLYSTKPDMLFLNAEVAFHNNSDKVNEINRLADSIAQESVLLKREYNLQLVYVPIPDKLSIYFNAVKLPYPYSYDRYLPFLEQALADRGVVVVDVYGVFSRFRQTNPNELLYYSGDTHYTPLGKTMAETELIKTLNQLPN